MHLHCNLHSCRLQRMEKEVLHQRELHSEPFSVLLVRSWHGFLFYFPPLLRGILLRSVTHISNCCLINKRRKRCIMLTSTDAQKALPLKMNCDIQQWVFLIDSAEISYCNILIIFIYIARLVSWNSKEPVGMEEMSYGLNTRKGCETLTVHWRSCLLCFI